MVGQFAPGHSRHDDIGQQQVNGAGMSIGDQDCGRGVAGIEHGVSLALQVFAGETQHGDFVFDQQNGFAAWVDVVRLRPQVAPQPLLRSHCHPRQVNLERCSLAGLAVDPDVASALLDDAVDRGKAESRALRSFGAEKRFEDAALGLGIHSHAGVADGQHHVLAGFRRGVKTGITLVQRDIGGLNRELAAARHGVARIDRQIHDDLLDLAGIGFGRAQFAPRNHDQLDVFADQASQHFEVFRDHRVQIENLGSQHLLAAEGQELAGERGGAVGGIGNFLRGPAHRRIGADALQQKLAVAGDHHQQIVEVVGNAAGQAADGFHLLGLAKLLFQRAMLGHILGEQLEEDCVVFVANGASRKGAR